MEKQKGVKKINLFSSEGRDILCQIVQERLNDVLDQSESTVRMIDEERRETSTIIGCDPHCHSCDVTFTTREEQVSVDYSKSRDHSYCNCVLCCVV